jgi:hypothetical protein
MKRICGIVHVLCCMRAVHDVSVFNLEMRKTENPFSFLDAASCTRFHLLFHSFVNSGSIFARLFSIERWS